jgi:26S proteasome regulatory subunit N1
MGLVFMGHQGRCEASLEVVGFYADNLAVFYRTTIESCAYAGTGNVLKIQDNLRVCTGENEIEQAAAVIGIATIALGDTVGCQMVRRMFEQVLQFGRSYARRMVPIGLALTAIANPQPDVVDNLHRIGHDPDPATAKNAIIALGLLGAGTQNTRVINTLRSLAEFHKETSGNVMLAKISEGLVQLGQGLMTLSPTYGDSLLLHPVALASLLVVAYASIMAEELIVKSDPLLLFFVAPAISPRLLITLDEELNIVPVQVRVGAAVDVVGQAGRPRTIAGFQQIETPAVIAVGQRAELADESYEPLSPILEGFVIVRKRSDKAVP